MKISRLLELHHKFTSTTSLSTNLGDGFLISHNRIYRNIRNQILKVGFQLSDAPNPFYQALPLSQLEALLSAQKIPYTDNVSVLKDIEAKIPNMTDWDDITDNLKTNQIFHESCHGVARDVFQKNLAMSFEHRTPLMLFEESFANCCELFAICDVDDPAHRIFFKINSYTSLNEERSHLNLAQKNFGASGLAKFLFFSYLHANFLHESLDESQFLRVLKLSFDSSQLTPKDLKTLRALSKISFRLDLRFRVVTTRFYLRLCGIPKDLGPLSEIDFLEPFESDPKYLKCLDLLVNISLAP